MPTESVVSVVCLSLGRSVRLFFKTHYSDRDCDSKSIQFAKRTEKRGPLFTLWFFYCCLSLCVSYSVIVAWPQSHTGVPLESRSTCSFYTSQTHFNVSFNLVIHLCIHFHMDSSTRSTHTHRHTHVDLKNPHL